MSSQEQPSLNKKKNPTTTDIIKAKESSNYNYYRLILLVCLFLFLSVLLYGSVLTATDVKKPLAVSGAEYDLYINYNKGNSDPANSTVMLGATNSNPKVNFDKLKEFEVYRQCSENSDCVMNLNTGYKRCPADKNTGLLYDVRDEICTKSSTCPQLTKFRFAVKKDGEALDGNCGSNNDRCRCVAKQQCATKVVSDFFSINGDVYAANTDGYAFQISDPKEHAYENVIFEDAEANSEFCKLNPAYTDRIINGCDFQNSVGDPLDCINTQDVYFQPYNINFTFVGIIYIGQYKPVLNTSNIFASDNMTDAVYGADTIFLQYPIADFIDNNNFEFYFNFEYNDTNFIIRTNKPNTNSSYDVPIESYNNGTDFNYTNIPEAGNLLLTMKNISYYSPETNGWVNGAPLDLVLKFGDTCTLSSIITNRCNPGDFGANFKNMLNCVQNTNQPCVASNLGYNVDNIGLAERGPFCRYDTNNDRNDFTSDKYYIKDASYYTLSCLIGKGCGKELDTSFPTEESIKIKKSKLFPTTDIDAVSNLWFLTNFDNSLNITTGTGNINFNNSFLELNIGDYWLDGRGGNTFLTCKSKIDGPSNKIELFENPHFNGVSTGFLVSVNPGLSVGEQVKISEVFPSASYPNINGLSFNKTAGISFHLNDEVTIYNAKEISDLININYGTVGKNNILYKNNNVFDGEMSEVTIFKQFGFNGINYNTFYDLKDQKRYYSDSYQYYRFFGNQTPGFPKNGNFYLASPPISLNQISSLEADSSGAKRNNPQIATMLDYTANFKIEKNMYYPTWDPNKFQQVCQMCQPTFINFTQIDSDKSVNGCTIQFSSADFKNYAYGFDKQAGSNYSSYYYTTFLSVGTSGGRDDLTSNTSLLVFNEDITKYGISVGDYIIDEEGFYGKNLVYHGTQYEALSKLGSVPQSNVINIARQDSIKSDQYLLDDRFVPYNIEGTSYSYNSFNLRPSTDQTTFDIDDSAGKIPNIFAGKFYTYNDGNNYQLFTLQPQITIKNIITNPQQTGGLTLVETTSPVTENLKENSLLQFISKDKKLGLYVARNYEDNAINNPNENNAEIIVNGITQGRITDLKITNPGANYLNVKKPVVLINEYNIFDVSKRILF